MGAKSFMGERSYFNNCSLIPGDLVYTGWILMIDQKYFLTVTPFWAQTIFYAYGGLTRGGPFDKIAFSVFESI